MNDLRFIAITILIIGIQTTALSQSRLKPYINAGYVTNIALGDDSEKLDRGGSIRFGILNKGLFGNGRFGFYTGYLWFNKHYSPVAEYNDRGTVIMAGFDILALKKGRSNIYLKAGLGREKFTSTYTSTTRVEKEISYKPDFGILYNIKNFNAYLGWQPSSPSLINIGIGYTFDSSMFNKGSDY